MHLLIILYVTFIKFHFNLFIYVSIIFVDLFFIYLDLFCIVHVN